MYGEYDEKTLAMLHEAELTMLRDVNALCEKHGIKYFVIAGTAIGAVRHQGFIPWDDDIDIAMLRPEYEKFIKAAREELSDRYEMSGPGFENHNYNLLASFVKKGTLFVNDAAWAAGMNPGLSVDIFIYDNIPDKLEEAMPLIRRCKRYAVLYQAGRVNFFKLIKKQKGNINKIKFFISGCIGLIIRMIPGEIERISSKYLKATAAYSGKTRHYTSLCDPGASFMDIYEEDILPYVKLPFEDTYVWMINKYDKQIRQHMGENYMQLPPAHKRTNHFPVRMELDGE